MGGSSAAERASVWAFWELCQAKIVPHFYRSLMLQSKPEQQSALESMLQGMREASVLMARQSPAGFFLVRCQLNAAPTEIFVWLDVLTRRCAAARASSTAWPTCR